MRVEFLFELSGLAGQETLVIKACAPNVKFVEPVASTLVEQYSSVHVRESRTLGQPDFRRCGQLQSRGGNLSGYRSGKGKSKTYSKAYTVDAWQYDEEGWPEDKTSYPAFETDATSRYPLMDAEDDGEGHEDREVSESEAIAPNCLEESKESSEAGHEVQSKLAARAALAKAK